MKRVVLILILLIGSFSFSSAKVLWEESYIKLNNGKVIWARLDNDSGCYGISVGGINTDIYGSASNCGENINGTWSVRANGNGATWVHGGLEDVINEIITNR